MKRDCPERVLTEALSSAHAAPSSGEPQSGARTVSFGVLLITLAALVVELMLTRGLDVVLAPNISYFVVSVAVFGFGLAGLYATLRPIRAAGDMGKTLARSCIAFAAAAALVVPVVDVLPLDFNAFGSRPFITLGSFCALYLVVIAPFFFAGYVLIAVFSRYSARIQRLYFWDLAGAGIGTIAVVPFIERIGPGGLILCAAGLGLVAAASFTPAPGTRVGMLVAAAVLFAVPAHRGQRYIDFAYHTDKRGIVTATREHRDRLVRWDPISKIDVIDETLSPETRSPYHLIGDRMAIQYDGGNQTSYFYKFDGDIAGLRRHLDRDLSDVKAHFWQIGVLAAHYLKRDSNPSVLIIGSAGGQETKAALVYGAAYIDAVEMVPTVVRLGRTRYSSYIGNIFHNPRVHEYADEGRSFLRHTGRRYDIIQIYSNYTSSSIAEGNGAMEPEYLQTADAYEEYFSHLTADGVLQVNHYAYPRVITTAALAWRRTGRVDFARHVAVFFSRNELTLPTILIKMQPWTAAEIASLERFLGSAQLPRNGALVLVENPLKPAKRFLSGAFYSGAFPAALSDRLTVDYSPRTDDHPYIGMMRKSLRRLVPGRDAFVDPGTAYVLNSEMRHGIPMELIHLALTGIVSLIFVALFVLLPLKFSRVGVEEGARAAPMLGYFSCLGAAFIVIELVLIQKFMQLIGSPLYTYSAVIFTLLLGAGVGSALSGRLRLSPHRGWPVPFVCIVVVGSLLIAVFQAVDHAALALSLPARVLLSGTIIFPLGFFMGMPFPLGILALEHRPRGAIAWAWGMNGVFTVVGGLLSVLMSLAFGFNATIAFALALYAVALGLFRPMRDGTLGTGTRPIAGRYDPTSGGGVTCNPNACCRSRPCCAVFLWVPLSRRTSIRSRTPTLRPRSSRNWSGTSERGRATSV